MAVRDCLIRQINFRVVGLIELRAVVGQFLWTVGFRRTGVVLWNIFGEIVWHFGGLAGHLGSLLSGGLNGNCGAGMPAVAIAWPR